jgi:hypothetical protein
MSQRSYSLRGTDRDPKPEPKPPVNHEYPAVRYHRSGQQIVVHSPGQEPSGDDWDTKPWPQELPDDEPETIASLTAKFNRAHGIVKAENASLKEENEQLRAALEKGKKKS